MALLGGGGLAAADDDEEVPTAPAAPPGGKPLPQKAPAPRKPVRSATAPVPGAVKGNDGFWYVKKGAQWFRVDQ